jgi:hypothetical protein
MNTTDECLLVLSDQEKEQLLDFMVQFGCFAGDKALFKQTLNKVLNASHVRDVSLFEGLFGRRRYEVQDNGRTGDHGG